MNKLRNHKGMSLGEILVAVIMVVLVSISLVTGVILANNQLTKQMRLAEANELYTTLSSLLTNELRYTRTVNLKGSSDTVDSFYSVTYAIKDDLVSIVNLDEDGTVINNDEYGQLALGIDSEFNRLVGSKAYGDYKLGARVNELKYDADSKLFTVKLDIGVIDGDSVINREFNVRAINNITINGASS